MEFTYIILVSLAAFSVFKKKKAYGLKFPASLLRVFLLAHLLMPVTSLTAFNLIHKPYMSYVIFFIIFIQLFVSPCPFTFVYTVLDSS